jgi:3-oxoacyl-[acyl-carrier protein] reductase
MDLGLEGKIALLTGASRGLGFATAKILAQEGVRIAINARDEETLAAAVDQLTQFSSDIISLPGDLTDPEKPQQIVTAALAVFGGIDLLFTNTGGPPPAAFEEVDDAAWMRGLTSPS